MLRFPIALLLLTLPTLAQETWRFDNLERIGGHAVRVLGHPRVIDTPQGKAVEFSGVDDALFFDVHPLAGAREFTWEVIFRPDEGGRPEQRFFHLQEQDANGADTPTRLLFETRLVGNQWCLDSYARSGEAQAALIDRTRLHPLGRWVHVAAVYDGRQFRNYVDGVLENSTELQLAPQGRGRSSAGVRINLRDYFKGAIRVARMTPRALAPSEFLQK